MTPFSKILLGDCIARMHEMPPLSVHVCVTSPPYFQLRDYGVAGQIGLEPTIEAYLAKLVDVFRAVRRVLRDDGLLWVNMGDSYAVSGKGGNPEESQHRKQATNAGSLIAGSKKPHAGFKGGDIMGMPWRLAFALQVDGWIFRGESVWCKRSPMPESISGTRWERCRVKLAGCSAPNSGGVRTGDVNGWTAKTHPASREPAKYANCPGCSRCEPNGGYVLRRGSWRHTRAHEYVFQFAKSPGYFADSYAVAEQSTTGASQRTTRHYDTAARYGAGNGGNRGLDELASRMKEGGHSTRNPRSFVLLSNEPNKEKHFAAFPTKLIEPLIKASVSAKGYCSSCGEPWARIIEKKRVPTRPALNPKVWRADEYDAIGQRSELSPNRDPERHVSETVTLGWRPTCRCNCEQTTPATILDPFAGTATTGVVAKRLGLSFIGCELNPDYVEIANRRLVRALDVKPRKYKRSRAVVAAQGVLFGAADEP